MNRARNPVRVLPGQPALSAFRVQRLLEALRRQPGARPGRASGG